MEKAAKISENKLSFGPWTVTATKTHISDENERKKFEDELTLPSIPEMIFGGNCLLLEHTGGFGVKFTALDALRLVDPEHDYLKVAASESWRKSRENCEHINRTIKPYDWTFSTDYKGTLFGDGELILQEEVTANTINTDRLKMREKIHFFDEVHLFEDELGDNGSSSMSVKMRVMPSCFLILQRFHLRVDDVMFRTYDTRIYHETGSNYLIREHVQKESSYSDIHLAPHQQVTDIDVISELLTHKSTRRTKLTIPEQCAESIDT